MKLLHTADLHLGKSLHEMPLLAEQEQMLQNIHDLLIRDDYAALLIAGDVYDRAIPPGEAVSLLSNFLAAVRRDCPDTAVCIIPGNHDSPQRLAFARSILENQCIYIAETMHAIGKPVMLTHAGETAALYLLPFLGFGAFRGIADSNDEKIGDSQAEMAAYAAEILKKTVNPAVPSVLLAHLFTLGGTSSSSERTFLGTAEYVDPALFSQFTYTALGHLHRFQKVTERMYYSGSPFPYAFDESSDKKCVLSVEIDCRTAGFPVMVTPIPLEPLRALYRLEGSMADFLDTARYTEYTDAYLEITLTDAAVVTNPMQLLRSRFPFVLTVRQKSFLEQQVVQEQEAAQIEQRTADDPDSITENFTAFEMLINNEVCEEKIALFTQLYKEIAHEA
ncbi:MAG: exonuclease SbcCD subunit D [Treponema sp.]